MPSRSSMRIALLAVLGLLVAAALGAAASRITSEQVGLYGQPPSVGNDLIAEPTAGERRPHRAKPKRHKDGDDSTGPAPAVPTETVPTETVPPPFTDAGTIDTTSAEQGEDEPAGGDADDD